MAERSPREISRRQFLGGAAAGIGAGAAVAALPGGGLAFADAAADAAATTVPALPPTTNAVELSRFGFMFPNLDPLRPDRDPKFTLANLHALAQTMPEAADPNINGSDDPNFDINHLGSARTYFGQFIDHDLTLDGQPQPAQFFSTNDNGKLLDPSGNPVYNFETFRFDLSSVYGGGPPVSAQLYASDGIHFQVVENNGNGVRDLPRLATGQAILVEGRNDENEIIAQVHIAFLKFHNAVADYLGPSATFAQVQSHVLHYYQWAVCHDFLPGWVGQTTVAGIANGSIPSFYRPGSFSHPYTALEWSVAAYRFGHSAVRDDYELNDTDTSHNIFDGTDNDLHGGRPLPAGRQIDWGDFELPLQSAANTAAGNTQAPRLVDTHISNGLFLLPIGGQSGAEVSGLSSLAERNLIRGFFYGLPSGQHIARAMGVPVIPPNRAIDPAVVPGFKAGTPAWYYMLKEAELAGGQYLGTVGGRIVADVFLGILRADPASYLYSGFTPKPPIAPAVGQFGIADLLVFAGVASRP
jgi:hypothetical protein